MTLDLRKFLNFPFHTLKRMKAAFCDAFKCKKLMNGFSAYNLFMCCKNEMIYIKKELASTGCAI